jgi:hypothetical protein
VSGELIALPFDGQYMMFNVDMLQTAMLVLLDSPGDFPENLKHCAAVLRDEHGFAKQDYVLYPVGAAIALDRGILMD